MSLKHVRTVDDNDDSLRLLRLQAHQISGILDPTMPIRALLNSDASCDGHTESHNDVSLVRKLSRNDAGRVINDRLAPQGFN